MSIVGVISSFLLLIFSIIKFIIAHDSGNTNDIIFYGVIAIFSFITFIHNKDKLEKEVDGCEES